MQWQKRKVIAEEPQQKKFSIASLIVDLITKIRTKITLTLFYEAVVAS